MHVVVLAGGLSAERDVSLRSGRRVAEALRETGVEVTELDADAALVERLRTDRPDAVVPVLHGAAGEDGALRDVLAALRVPFVGATAAAARLAFDKPVAKELARQAGLATPPALALPHALFRELGAGALLEAAAAHVGLPVVVKPARGGSALGASVVHEAAGLPAAMVGAFAYGEVALIERWVGGPGSTELAVCVVEDAGGPRALPVIEIRPPGDLYDYAARYTAGTTEFFVPARIDSAVAEAASAMALRLHEVLGLRDWSRTDLIVAADGTPWFLEVNVAPGMTETSLYPQAVSAAGLDLGALVRSLCERAITR